MRKHVAKGGSNAGSAGMSRDLAGISTISVMGVAKHGTGFCFVVRSSGNFAHHLLCVHGSKLE